MANDVDISNLAVAHLGDTANITSIDPPEGSVQAERAARFYPIARDSLLEMRDWDFSIRRQSGASLDIDLPPPWAYAYAIPDDCLAVLGVYEEEYLADIAVATGNSVSVTPQPFIIEIDDTTDSKVIFTNVENAVIRFKARVTDSARFSSLFVTCLSYLLASYLAGPTYKGKAGAQMAKEMLQTCMAFLPEAARHDANQNYQPVVHSPAWISNR